jgi:hypothetical protein
VVDPYPRVGATEGIAATSAMVVGMCEHEAIRGLFNCGFALIEGAADQSRSAKAAAV